MNITSEYIYNNIKLNETHNIVESTLQEYELKYDVDHQKDVRVNCVVKFSEKNVTKKIILWRWDINGAVNKTLRSSKDTFEIIRIIQLKIILNCRIYTDVIDLNFYLRSEKFPILWKKIFIKIANDRENLYNTPKRFIQCDRKKHVFDCNDCKVYMIVSDF